MYKCYHNRHSEKVWYLCQNSNGCERMECTCSCATQPHTKGCAFTYTLGQSERDMYMWSDTQTLIGSQRYFLDTNHSKEDSTPNYWHNYHEHYRGQVGHDIPSHSSNYICHMCLSTEKSLLLQMLFVCPLNRRCTPAALKEAQATVQEPSLSNSQRDRGGSRGGRLSGLQPLAPISYMLCCFLWLWPSVYI